MKDIIKQLRAALEKANSPGSGVPRQRARTELVETVLRVGPALLDRLEELERDVAEIDKFMVKMEKTYHELEAHPDFEELMKALGTPP